MDNPRASRRLALLIAAGVAIAIAAPAQADGWQPGADPAHADYNSFADFADPDGNTWVLQESNRYAA